MARLITGTLGLLLLLKPMTQDAHTTFTGSSDITVLSLSSPPSPRHTLQRPPSRPWGRPLPGPQWVSGHRCAPRDGIQVGVPGAAEGAGLEEAYLLKWSNGVCREVKGRVLGFLVVEELPLEAFTESHCPWL